MYRACPPSRPGTDGFPDSPPPFPPRAARAVSKRYNIPTNKYKVKAGQDQEFWESKGWIDPQDPRGWFQW